MSFPDGKIDECLRLMFVFQREMDLDLCSLRESLEPVVGIAHEIAHIVEQSGSIVSAFQVLRR